MLPTKRHILACKYSQGTVVMCVFDCTTDTSNVSSTKNNRPQKIIIGSCLHDSCRCFKSMMYKSISILYFQCLEGFRFSHKTSDRNFERSNSSYNRLQPIESAYLNKYTLYGVYKKGSSIYSCLTASN